MAMGMRVGLRLPQPLLLPAAGGSSRGAPGPSLPAGSGPTAVPGEAQGLRGGSPETRRGGRPKLRKTQGGKQEKKVIHPYSRKAAQLAREAHKQEKKEKLKTDKALRLSIIGEKLQWFQSHLDPNKIEYTKKEAGELIENYMCRFNAELEQIELQNSIKGRQGRQHGSRETVIKQTIERERQLYEGYGIEIPDIMNRKHLKFFREWDGDLRKLPNIKMKKLSAGDAACSHPEVADVEAKEELNKAEEVA
ncbi:translation machinery-associated protein 16 isoform X1 [Harpia harpyja]|uniref:translation machinery-associated protein 16 isoform X1 n=1 Tax=Harpia harpyja TaxID=202280 RepID=UPI0022B1C883|nr:translation machinery-associated protein 16 isoform X1 [Harpia harpyja]XP_052634470.1 translation machinery-associated protein 16 isoform X1 [Harpia harpyja]XP_052634479.1 translation machinery-associated protein 16 isoform X1 [Harpia harpyja]XP_052634487.1 translation machinery-associated protein 16 isoform X1 [Harpia harpyja]